jgi:hypothetical protein
MRTLDHNVRALDDQRRGWLKGKALPSATDIAVQKKAIELARGRGGLRKCNGIERSLIFDMALCALIRDAVLAEAERRGTLFTDTGALLPVFGALATFMNTSRLHALALGIRPESNGSSATLDAYLAKKAKKKQRAAAAPASEPVAADTTPASTDATEDTA